MSQLYRLIAIAFFLTGTHGCAHAQDATAPVPNSAPGAAAPANPAHQENPPSRPDDSSPGNASNSKPPRVGNDVKAPHLISSPDPYYTDDARRAGYEGTVVLWLVVDVNGVPQQVRVAHKIGMGLDEQAVEAVKKWRFRPATRNGQPVPVQINVEVNFGLGLTHHDPPLSSPPEFNATPPNFLGADLNKFPLVIHVGDVTAVPKGGSYEIHANASVDDHGTQKKVVLTCSSHRVDCSFIDSGNYPARWLDANQQVEITGPRSGTTKLDKVKYSVQQSP